jgi:GNAT superfamily N-acetyltransferase
VRPAASSDLSTLSALWIEITRHHEPLDPLFRLRPGAEVEVRELLRAWLHDPDARAFLAEVESAALGMVCVRIDRAPPILDEVERGEITDLFVRAAWRRRGVGRALADAALDWLIAGVGASRCRSRMRTPGRSRSGAASASALTSGPPAPPASAVARHAERGVRAGVVPLPSRARGRSPWNPLPSRAS